MSKSTSKTPSNRSKLTKRILIGVGITLVLVYIVFLFITTNFLGNNNIVPTYTWIQVQGTPKAFIKGDSNYVHIDQKDDTKWTANIHLHFTDCRQGKCDESLPPILFEGRLHYWISEDDR